MAQVLIKGVIANKAASFWGVVEPWIQSALDTCGNLMSTNDMLECIINRDCQLWVVYIDDILVAAITTSIIQHPQKKVLTVGAIGGKYMERWVAHLDQLLMAYAKHHECDVIDSYGRRGWSKQLADLGWSTGCTTYMKEVI